MHWYHYIAYFLRGRIPCQFAASSQQWDFGACLSEPLRITARVGLSSSVVNVIWGFFNLGVGYLLVCCIGSFNLRKTQDVLGARAGILITSLMLAMGSDDSHGGNRPVQR